MLNACASLFNGVNFGKAMDEGETGHFAVFNAYGLSILDYGEANTLTSVDLSNPHRQSRSVLKSLPFLDFNRARHLDLRCYQSLFGKAMLSSCPGSAGIG
jgi:hypothetical protein